MGCVTSTISRGYLRKQTVSNLGGNMKAQSQWSECCVLCTCWGLYVDFLFCLRI